MSAPTSRPWPRELLGVLFLAPPVLGLIFELEGIHHAPLHQARSLDRGAAPTLGGAAVHLGVEAF